MQLSGSDLSKRTPGPWIIDHAHPDDADTATIHAPSALWWVAQSDDANAAFIVACENAMTAAGIVNPEAVPEIVQLLEELRATDHDSFVLMRGDLGDRLEAALAKARGTA